MIGDGAVEPGAQRPQIDLEHPHQEFAQFIDLGAQLRADLAHA
jgi:hypothetical protein